MGQSCYELHSLELKSSVIKPIATLLSSVLTSHHVVSPPCLPVPPIGRVGSGRQNQTYNRRLQCVWRGVCVSMKIATDTNCDCSSSSSQVHRRCFSFNMSFATFPSLAHPRIPQASHWTPERMKKSVNRVDTRLTKRNELQSKHHLPIKTKTTYSEYLASRHDTSATSTTQEPSIRAPGQAGWEWGNDKGDTCASSLPSPHESTTRRHACTTESAPAERISPLTTRTPGR